MSFLPAADEAPVFKGATLVVADVSRGNVGQLAADLLITTMQMTRVGYFDDPDVLPAVGATRSVDRAPLPSYRSHGLFACRLQNWRGCPCSCLPLPRPLYSLPSAQAWKTAS